MEDPREADRLVAKVDAEAWVNTYLLALLPAHGRILDVGCGPGAIATAAKNSEPTVAVIGVDLSFDRLKAVRNKPEGSPAFLQADALALPFRDDTYDLVYTRFLLQYLEEPQSAVAEMARVCRPGGQVVLQDLDGQFVWHYPPDPILEDLLTRALAALEKTGFNPFVGRRLHHLLVNAGLEEIQVRLDGYHLIAGKISPSERKQWELKLTIAQPEIARAIGAFEACDLLDRLLTYLDRADTITYSTVFTATGCRPSQ